MSELLMKLLDTKGILQMCPHPALLLLLLGLLFFKTSHTGVAGGAGEAGDAL